MLGRQEIERLEFDSASLEEMLSESQTTLQSATSEVMSISVDLARAEQKVEALNATMQQQKRDQSQREAAVEEVRQVAVEGRRRLDQLTLRVLDATSQLAELQWDSEKCKERLRGLAVNAEQVKRDNREIMKASEDAMKEGRVCQRSRTRNHRAARQRQTET